MPSSTRCLIGPFRTYTTRRTRNQQVGKRIREVKIDVFANADAAAQAAAKLIAASARAAVSERGKFTVAVSGGRTPATMLRDLAREDVPWDRVHVFQVDERIA